MFTPSVRSELIKIVGAAILGLAAGLIVAWGIWPVKWTSATLDELRPDLQAYYMAAVADAYTASGGRETVLAGQRLAQFRDPQRAIENAIRFFQESGDAERNIRIFNLRRLAGGQGLSVSVAPDAEAVTAPESVEVQDAVAENVSMRSEGRAAGPPMGWLNWTLGVLGAVLLVGGGVWLGYYVYYAYRARVAERAGRAEEAEQGEAPPQTTPAAESAVDVSEAEPATGEAAPPIQPEAAETAPAVESEPTGILRIRPFARKAAGDTVPDGETTAESETGVASQGGSAFQFLRRGRSRPATVARGGPEAFVAQYTMDILDYDQSFSLPGNGDQEPIGACGMGVNLDEDAVDSDPERVMALDVWLYDRSDIRSFTCVLASEHADLESLRQRNKDAIDIFTAAPGLTFRLESNRLRLDCEVTGLDYIESDPNMGAFKTVTVEMTVYCTEPQPDS